MKVVVLYDNPVEKTLADNLVKVIKKIGAMLVYGKVNYDGVLLEDWKSKPPTNIECVAGPSPTVAVPSSAGVVKYGAPGFDGYTFEMDMNGYAVMKPSPTYQKPAVTRELARDLVRMFPDSIEAKRKNTKPVVPKPDTTKTGVTVRDLDMWEDEHE